MNNQAKTLITLTDLLVNEEGKIQFSITDGHTQFTGTSSSVDTLIGDIGHLAAEFNAATLRMGLIGNIAPIEAMKRYYKVAIDLELARIMQKQFEALGDHPLIAIYEFVINAFDSVNGNRGVSTAVGIAGLVNHLQAQPTEEEIRPVFNRLDKILFHTNPTDPESNNTQLIESTDPETGTVVALRTTHALGNVFAEGTIGKVKVRILKREGISLFVTLTDEFPPQSSNFPLSSRKAFFDVLQMLVIGKTA